jgi:hypothetical protein
MNQIRSFRAIGFQDVLKVRREIISNYYMIRIISKFNNGLRKPELFNRISKFFIIAFLFIFPEFTMGDEFILTPSISMKEEFNDNIFMTEKDKKDDFITTISPGIELVNKTERLYLNLYARLDNLIYAQNDELNFLNHNYRGSFSYSFSPQLRLSAEGGVTRDFSPDRDLEVSGIVTKAIKRYKYNFSGGLEYNLTESTSTNLSYTYERSDYDHDPEFPDQTSNGVNLSLIHDLSKYISNTGGRLNIGYNRYESPATKVDYYYATAGFFRAISENWNLILDGGMGYTISEYEVERLKFIPPFFFQIVREKEREEGKGWVAQASLSYKGEKTVRGEKTRGDLTFTHRIMPASGTVGVSERSSLVMNIFHQFDYEFSGGISFTYHKNRAEKGKYSISSINEETFSIRPRIKYEFSKDIAIEASHSLVFIRDKEAHSDTGRNIFMVNLVIKYPLFE